MKRRLFIFTVSIMTIFGTYGASYANIPDVQYVTDQLTTKLDKNLGPDKQGNALVIDPAGAVTPGKITEDHLAQGIKDKINNALNGLEGKANVALDNISVGTGHANKVLTVTSTGGVTPAFVSIPVGQTGANGAANVWIEQ